MKVEIETNSGNTYKKAEETEIEMEMKIINKKKQIKKEIKIDI